MTTKTEKLMIASAVVGALVAFALILQNDVSQIEKQTSATPEAVAACAKIASKAHGAFSQAKELAVMEECLIQRDPAYAATREAEMCLQAKASGAKQEVFTDDFRKFCFRNG